MKNNNKPTIQIKDEIEIRCFSGNMRSTSIDPASNASKSFEGYAARYNEISDVLGNFREKIAPGFFDDVNRYDVRALFNHDKNFVLGRSSAGTLKLFPDSVGLRVEITPPPAQWAIDLSESIRRGDINQMSFAFTMPKDGKGEKWEKDSNGNWLRTLIKPNQIFDVSIVTTPAYPQTSVSVNSFVAGIKARAAARKRTLDLLDPGGKVRSQAVAARAAARRRFLQIIGR